MPKADLPFKRSRSNNATRSKASSARFRASRKSGLALGGWVDLSVGALKGVHAQGMSRIAMSAVELV